MSKQQTALRSAIAMIQSAPHMLNMEDTIHLLTGFLPTERNQIEQAHMMGSKKGWTDCANILDGAKPITTAHTDATNYFTNTYEMP